MSSSIPLVPGGEEKSLGEVYKAIGFGRYQWQLFILCGLGFMADSIEVGVITFLESEAEKEWDLHGFEKNALAVVVFWGEFLGGFLWGPLADRVGRKAAFLLSNATLLLFSCLSAAAPSFWSLVALRGLVGISIGGIVVPFDNLTESVSEEHKNVLGYAMEFWWTAGTLYVTGLAAAVLPSTWGNWRGFVLLTTAPILLVCLGGLVIEESPMWLQDIGCNEEAMQILQRVARLNRRDISGLALAPYEREAEPSFVELFSSFRRRTAAMSLIWLLGLFGYYGASLANTFIFDEGNGVDYGEIIFASSGEVVGVIFAIVAGRQLGAVQTMGTSYFITAVASLSIVASSLLRGKVTKEVSKALVLILAFFLRLGGMAGSACIWVVTPAAYPTYVRSTAHSVLFSAGRVGGLLATLWPSSTPVALIMSVYGLANGVTSVLSFWEGRHLQHAGVFASFASDLDATDLDRRSRSAAARSARNSTDASRLSLFRSGRMSRPSHPSITPGAREVSGFQTEQNIP